MPAFSRPAKVLLFLIPGLGCLFLFAGAGLPGCNSSKEPTVSAKHLEEVQASLQRIERELTGLRHGIPKETEQRLTDLESVLNDPKQWPQKPDQVEKLRQDLDGIVQNLPPLVAERILPTLVRLNWGVEALWNLRTHAHPEASQLEEVQASIKDVLDRHPQAHFKELHKGLDARLTLLQPQIRLFHLKQLLKRANLAFQDKEDAGAVYSSLEEYQGDKEVALVLPKLRVMVLEKTGTERVRGFEKTLKQTHSLADDRFRQVSVATVQDGLVRLIVDLQLDEASPKDVIGKAKILLAQCDKELQAFASRQQQENAKKLRRYQAWALERIRKLDGPGGWYYDVTLPWVNGQLEKFRNAADDEEWLAFQEFPSIKELVQEKVGVELSGMKGAMLTAEKRKEIYNMASKVLGWKNNIDTEIAYRATRDGMVKFLLPIQPHLLDPPVAQLYQQAFAKGWQKLEGREDQLHVAKQSALVAKKTVEEIASSNR